MLLLDGEHKENMKKGDDRAYQEWGSGEFFSLH